VNYRPALSPLACRFAALTLFAALGSAGSGAPLGEVTGRNPPAPSQQAVPGKEWPALRFDIPRDAIGALSCRLALDPEDQRTLLEAYGLYAGDQSALNRRTADGVRFHQAEIEAARVEWIATHQPPKDPNSPPKPPVPLDQAAFLLEIHERGLDAPLLKIQRQSMAESFRNAEVFLSRSEAALGESDRQIARAFIIRAIVAKDMDVPYRPGFDFSTECEFERLVLKALKEIPSIGQHFRASVCGERSIGVHPLTPEAKEILDEYTFTLAVADLAYVAQMTSPSGIRRGVKELTEDSSDLRNWQQNLRRTKGVAIKALLTAVDGLAQLLDLDEEDDLAGNRWIEFALGLAAPHAGGRWWIEDNFDRFQEAAVAADAQNAWEISELVTRFVTESTAARIAAARTEADIIISKCGSLETISEDGAYAYSKLIESMKTVDVAHEALLKEIARRLAASEATFVEAVNKARQTQPQGFSRATHLAEIQPGPRRRYEVR